MIVTFIAGQHFAKNVANIEFEFDVISSWHSDMAKSFTSFQENLFPNAKRLSCCIHIIRNFETRLKAHFFKDDIIYNIIKQQAYMLKYGALVVQFGVLCQLFTMIWRDVFEAVRLSPLRRCVLLAVGGGWWAPNHRRAVHTSVPRV